MYNVQKDDIISYDKTFKRLCGVSKTSTDMVGRDKKFKSKKTSLTMNLNLFTFRSNLETTRKIGLFIELEGLPILVIDVVKWSRRNMSEVVLLL